MVSNRGVVHGQWHNPLSIIRAKKENQVKKLDSARVEAYKNRMVPVDKSKLNYGNSYETPPDYFKDIDFNCIDRGSRETWLAEQQGGGMRKRAVIILTQPFDAEVVVLLKGKGRLKQDVYNLKASR